MLFLAAPRHGRQEPVEAIHDRVKVSSRTSLCRWVEELAGRASLKVLRAASPEAMSFYEMMVHPEHVSAAHEQTYRAAGVSL